ncbi:putative alcohol dehydrogenase [Aeropyrum pernix]|uniref:Putative alcohol dehydrogenase n=1 Tax=Aeropyrum pernix TaxID=56636 RepID=A0A401H858_AERPX|nr:alcohol dehydrogenase catalytic domain-containing protein [Aeropyrum pernix]GBF08594.1 putative alcohol dehydrogenase [Aeropyrum pernix]
MKDRFKAAVLYGWREPFRLEEYEVEPPEGWVPVEVRSVGMCGRDLVVWKGGFPNLKPPLVLGHEVFGLHDGRPVSVYPAIAVPGCPDCPPSILGENLPGGYAERVYVPPENLIPLPDADFNKYAAATCGVATMMHAASVAGVRPGERVLVTGASGGVALHGIQYLQLLGAEVVAYTRSREKARMLEEELGVEAVTSLDFYRERGRVDVVMETVGAPTINESMRALRPRGRLVLIGNITGEPVTIKRPALLVMREITISGTAAFTRKEWEAAIKTIAKGGVKPYYKAYSLDKINNALKEALEGARIGRIVINP